MSGLFDDIEREQADRQRPLAERCRPRVLDDVVGQTHLLGPGAPLRTLVERGTIPSMILWGPPGTGKTTLAAAICATAGLSMQRLSAVEAGVKELREIIAQAARQLQRSHRMVLFIDEIHRFNKAQQDALLHAVERGTITLIGATTENPSFEVNAALLSRCQVYRLRSLTDDEVRQIVERAIATDPQLIDLHVTVEDWDALLSVAGGDARSALNAVEASAAIAEPTAQFERVLTRDLIRTAVQQRVLRYDRAGDQHYDTISAFIKSMRGSDPDAAMLYLAAMIESGEDPIFIARRMIIFASEDIGNADPRALQLAVATFQAVERIGMPEGRIPLGQCVAYLASAPKSNASYNAIDAALEVIRQGADLTIPLHLRNAPTRLMKDEGYGVAYRYPHSFPGHFVDESYFPEGMTPTVFYRPDGDGAEAAIRERLKKWWSKRWDDSSV